MHVRASEMEGPQWQQDVPSGHSYQEVWKVETCSLRGTLRTTLETLYRVWKQLIQCEADSYGVV